LTRCHLESSQAEADHELLASNSLPTPVRRYRLRCQLFLEWRSRHERPICNGFDSARSDRQAGNTHELCRRGTTNDASGCCCRCWNCRRRHCRLLLFKVCANRRCLWASIHQVLADRCVGEPRNEEAKARTPSAEELAMDPEACCLCRGRDGETKQ
jgi:hypothetical protein